VDWASVQKLEALEFVNRDGRHLAVTPKGFPLLDAILPQIVAIEPTPDA
ncbi:MAG TPA: coproporphyrinogen III oxidase, partial [Sphingorhabdus sp.]|nr:coproporphyrinogen III oxidase [Sphingorhabdus sp.]